MDKPTTRKGRPPAATQRKKATPKTRKKAASSRTQTARRTTAVARRKPSPAINLDAPELYLNRELTWLEFNRRVLHMAADKATPLLERVKFLAIVSANLDEFFMKRVGGLKQQIAAGIRTPSVDGQTPAEQLKESHVIVRETHREQNRVYRQLHGLLEAQGIRLSRYAELEPREQNLLRDEFISNIFPLLTPLAMDPGHHFPLSPI